MITMRFRRTRSLASIALLTILLAALLTACGASASAQSAKGSGGVGAAGRDQIVAAGPRQVIVVKMIMADQNDGGAQGGRRIAHGFVEGIDQQPPAAAVR